MCNGYWAVKGLSKGNLEYACKLGLFDETEKVW